MSSSRASSSTAATYTAPEVPDSPIGSDAVGELVPAGAGKGKGFGRKSSKDGWQFVKAGSVSEEKPHWPNVRCPKCPTIDKWKNMLNNIRHRFVCQR